MPVDRKFIISINVFIAVLVINSLYAMITGDGTHGVILLALAFITALNVLLLLRRG
jgi:hypothetical protein